MSTRYLTNAAIALLGGFVVVASQAFSPAVIAWLGFAVAIAVLLIVAVAQFDSTRGAVSRALDGVLGALSIWTIVASQIFSGSTVMWLSFAEALGFVGLAFIGLTVHEVDTWRASHGLGAMAWAGEGASREESVRRAA